MRKELEMKYYKFNKISSKLRASPSLSKYSSSVGFSIKRYFLHGFFYHICHIQEIDPVAQKCIYSNFIGSIHHAGKITSFIQCFCCQRQDFGMFLISGSSNVSVFTFLKSYRGKLLGILLGNARAY